MTTLKEWLLLRARFAHDWLENRFLTFLLAEEGRRADPARRTETLRRLEEWQERRAVADRLLDTAEQVLSPAQLAGVPPLSEMPPDAAAELKEIVHEQFCARTSIREIVAAARACVWELDELVAQAAHSDLDAAIPQIRRSAGALDQALSRLPTRIVP